MVQLLRLLARLTAAACLAASPAALAAALAPADLMQALAQVRESRVTFVETRTSSLLRAPLVLEGELVYRRPDHLEKHVRQPYVESTTIDASRVTVTRAADRTRRTIDVPPGPAQALMEGLRATLAGDLEALVRYFDVAVSGERAAWQMVLTPRSADVAAVVSRVRFDGAHDRLSRIEVQEPGGDASVTVIGAPAR